jgi:hypothetical protein
MAIAVGERLHRPISDMTQSGEIYRPGAISKCGDEMMRMMLDEAAYIVLVRLANCPGSRPTA